MALYYLAVSIFITPNLHDLGSNNWYLRENATERLMSYGWVAVPYVVRLREQTTNPEVRNRTFEILKSYDWFEPKIDTIKVLCRDWEPPKGFWTYQRRIDVYNYVLSLGYGRLLYNQPHDYEQCAVWRIDPKWDGWDAVNKDVMHLTKHEQCNMAIVKVRAFLGVYPEAPMPKHK